MMPFLPDTTSAFSGASFIQRRYGWKYGKRAYLGASIVGVSRMKDQMDGMTFGISLQVQQLELVVHHLYKTLSKTKCVC